MATTTARLEQQTGTKGFFVSAAIHLVLLAILFFVTISSPVVDEFKEGLIIDFGDSPTGSGDDLEHFAGGSSSEVATSTPVPPSPSQPSQPVAAVTPVKTQTKTIVTEDPEAVALKKQKQLEEKQKQAELQKQKQLEIQKQKEAAAAAAKAAEEKKIKDAVASTFNKGKTGSGTGSGNSTGSGTGNGQGTNGTGNQGNPNGAINGNPNGTGTGTSGTDWSLKGRALVSKKVPFNNSQKSGKVLVLIKVDRMGKVYYAKGPQKGSTTTDPYLVKLSEDAAYQFKFNQNSEAAEEQVGTITFNYTFD